jgi:hypothetical protein
MTEPRYDPKRGERIPLARKELLEIASYLRDSGIDGMDKPAAHIETIVSELMYRNPKRKLSAPAKQTPITAHLVARVKAYLNEHPDLHDRVIGRMFGIDGGRVSEISQGQRTVEHPNGTPEWRGIKS